MRYLSAVMLTLLAASAGCIGGVLQGFAGPGSQPGLAITHLAAAIFVLALIVAVTGWLAGDHSHRQHPSEKAYITATDGRTVIPMLGPYETESAAFDALPHAKAQFDADDCYAWTVQTAPSDTTLIGLGNEHFTPASTTQS